VRGNEPWVKVGGRADERLVKSEQQNKVMEGKFSLVLCALRIDGSRVAMV